VERSFVFLKYVVPLFVVVGHCIIPGLYRLHTGYAFVGPSLIEYWIGILNLGVCLCSMYFLCVVLTNLIREFQNHAVVFDRLSSLTRAKVAQQKDFACYVDLRDGRNILAWMTLREGVVRERLENTQTYATVVAPAVLLNLAFIVLLIVRVAIQRKSFDIFNVLGLYDAIVLSIYLLTLLTMMVYANQLLGQEHIGIIEKQQFKIAKFLFENNDVAVREQLLSQLSMLEKAEKKLMNKELGLTVFGQLVDVPFMVRLLIPILSGIASGVAKILGIV